MVHLYDFRIGLWCEAGGLGHKLQENIDACRKVGGLHHSQVVGLVFKGSLRVLGEACGADNQGSVRSHAEQGGERS